MKRPARPKFEPTSKIYDPVWRCIYCGEPHSKDRPLGKEHIVPYSLGGAFVLPRASCMACSRLTKAFEETCARRMFGTLRIALNAQTRRPHERPKSLPIFLSRGAYQERIDVPAQDYPFITIMLPDFDPPRLLTGETLLENRRLQWRTFHGVKRNAKNPTLYLSPTAQIPGHVDLAAFYKLLAKIAHSFAVAELGLDSYRWLLPPLILGKTTNFSHLIGGINVLTGGTFKDIPVLKPRAVHRLSFEEKTCLATNKHYLVATIGLLYDCTPEYLVVLAEAP